MKELRPHQQTCIDQLRDSLRRGKKRPVLMAATGFGKTVVASHIIASARSRGKRVWMCVPRIGLVDQTVRALWDEGIRDVGVIQANHPMSNLGQPVQVISPATLENRDLGHVERPDLIIVDECHLGFEVIRKLMALWPEVPFVGLSATPWSKGLGRQYDDLIISATTADLIRLGFLKPFRVFAPSHPDLSGVKTVTTSHGRDYAEGQLSAAMQEGTLTGDIVSTWMERGRGRPTLCFGVDRAHAKALDEQFRNAGVRCRYQDGATPPAEREMIRTMFANGNLEVVCNIATLTTGIDWRVGCIILGRPTKSEILFTQIVGRGLRQDGEKELIVLDHSDTTLNLGFVTDIRHEKLDDGKPSKSSTTRKLKPPRECPKCTSLFPRGARFCEMCGFEPVLQPKDRDTVAGELAELDGDKAKRAPTMDEKVRWMRQLKAFQIETGKADGWVAHKFKAKFGTWPNDQCLRFCEPAAGVDPMIRSWIRSQAIRWAKSQQSREAVA